MAEELLRQMILRSRPAESNRTTRELKSRGVRVTPQLPTPSPEAPYGSYERFRRLRPRVSGGELPMPLPEQQDLIDQAQLKRRPLPITPEMSGGELPMPFPSRPPLVNTISIMRPQIAPIVPTQDSVSASIAPTPVRSKELPYQTFQRLTGERWSGGCSNAITRMLDQFGINARPGSAEANLALQKALLANAKGIQ